MAILALSPRMSATRDRLANLLWSDRDDEHARSSLRQSLKLLRRELGDPSPLISNDEQIALVTNLIEVDALEFVSAIEQADLPSLRRATELYRSDLLSGFSLSDPAFEEWLTGERRRLHKQAEMTLFKLLSNRMQDVDDDCAAAAAELLLLLDPVSEIACRKLMKIAVERGQSTQALKLYEELKERLRRDFDAQPEPLTTELYELMRQHRMVVSRPDQRSLMTRTPLPLPSKPSIAVLPFQNLSGDSNQDYFVDGMVDEIIMALSQMRWLFVIARNSSFFYKGKSVDVRQVGRDLGVRYVLEGSIRRSGNRVRLLGELVDTSTSTQLWAEKFEGRLEDIFELQDQMAMQVVGALTPQIERVEIERAKHKPSQNLDAYDYYLRSKAAYYRWAEESTYEALRLLNLSMELDPNFAPAYAMAARCHTWLKWNGWLECGNDEVATVTNLARRALELSKDDAAVLCYAGWALAYIADDFETGLEFIDRATEINPNLAPAWLFSGTVRLFQGDPSKAIEHFNYGMRLSPFDPVMPRLQVSAALAHLMIDKFDEASLLSEKTLHHIPEDREALRTKAASNAFAGRLATAHEAMARLRHIDPDLRLTNLRDRISLRRAADIAKLTEGLRRAGLPE